MAFSNTRSMTPLSLSSVLIVRSVTCFISWLNIWGVSLFKMLRTFRNNSWRARKQIADTAVNSIQNNQNNKINTLSKETKQDSKDVRASNKSQCLTRTKASTWQLHHLVQTPECFFYCEYFTLTDNHNKRTWIHTWVFRASGSSGTLSLFIPGFQAFSDFLSWTSSITETFTMILRGGGRRTCISFV